VFPSSGSVLEIGSYQVNESGSLRAIFSGCSYTGVDLAEGPGVDIVASGHDVNLTFGQLRRDAFCGIEHNPLWRRSAVTGITARAAKRAAGPP
jgi:hypothetical protein